MATKILGYNLRKPYKMVVSKEGALIIQNGMVYERGSGRCLGKVSDKLKVENQEVVYCKFSGATFPNTEAGKLALKEYQERKGYLDKEADGKRQDKESSLEERKAEIAAKREKINKKKEEE